MKHKFNYLTRMLNGGSTVVDTTVSMRSHSSVQLTTSPFRGLGGSIVHRALCIVNLLIILGIGQVWAANEGWYENNMWQIYGYKTGYQSDGWLMTGLGSGTDADFGIVTDDNYWLKGLGVNTWGKSANGVRCYYAFPDGGQDNKWLNFNSGESDKYWEKTDIWNYQLTSALVGNHEINLYFKMQVDAAGGELHKNNRKIKWTVPGFKQTSVSQTDFAAGVGGNQSKTISFTQHYGNTLNTGNCSLSGNNSSEFSVTGISETGVTVKFAPTSVGSKSATLTITDAHDKTCTITLQGSATNSYTGDLYIVGSCTNADWTDQPSDEYKLTGDGQGHYTWTGTLKTASNWDAGFKFLKGKNWCDYGSYGAKDNLQESHNPSKYEEVRYRNHIDPNNEGTYNLQRRIECQGNDQTFFVTANDGVYTLTLDLTDQDNGTMTITKKYYIKHPWGGGDWTWKELTSNGDGTYSVEAQYGNAGCNWNTKADGAGQQWVASPTLVNNPTTGDECTFTLNPTAQTITITKNTPTPTESTTIYVLSHYASNGGSGDCYVNIRAFDTNNFTMINPSSSYNNNDDGTPNYHMVKLGDIYINNKQYYLYKSEFTGKAKFRVFGRSSSDGKYDSGKKLLGKLFGDNTSSYTTTSYYFDEGKDNDSKSIDSDANVKESPYAPLSASAATTTFAQGTLDLTSIITTTGTLKNSGAELEYYVDNNKVNTPSQWSATNGEHTVTVKYRGGINEITSPITLTIIAAKKTVTFHSNGGTEVASQQVSEGGTATKPSNPTKNGNTFQNWYSNSDCTGDAFNFSTPITTDIDLYAKWTPSGNIKFVSSLGKNDNGWDKNKGIDFTNNNGVYTVTYMAPKGRNHFEAWADGSDSKKVPQEIDPHSLVTIGQENGHMYFDLTKIQQVTITYNGKFSVSAQDYTPTFEDVWYLTTGGSWGGKILRPDGSEVDMNADWKKAVVENGNNKLYNVGGVNALIVLGVPSGDKEFKLIRVNTDDCCPGKDVFNALYVDTSNPPSGLTWYNGHDSDFGTDVPHADGTANWRNIKFSLSKQMDLIVRFDGGKITISEYIPATCSVTFKVDGETFATQTIAKGGKATKPTDDPTKSGYRFLGWSETDGGAVVDVTTVTINEDKTFYAIWEKECETSTKYAYTIESKSDVETTSTGVTGGKIAISNLSQGGGGSNNIVTLKLASNYYVRMNSTNSKPEISTTLDDYCKWEEVPVSGGTFTPNWSKYKQKYQLYYLKNVKTGLYLYMGGSELGGGDWKYYITTAVNEQTATNDDKAKWFYVNTGSTLHLCSFLNASNSDELDHTYNLMDFNVDNASLYSAAPVPNLVASKITDPDGNTWTKVHERNVVGTGGGGKTTPVTVGGHDYYRMTPSTAITATLNKALEEGDKVKLYLHATGSTTVTLKKGDTQLTTFAMNNNETAVKEYTVTSFDAGQTVLKISANNDDALIYKIEVVSKLDPELGWDADLSGGVALKIGETATHTASSALSTGAITYSSSNTAVATVNASGVVTAQAVGTTTITATQAADECYGKAEVTYTVTVSPAELTLEATPAIAAPNATVTATPDLTNFPPDIMICYALYKGTVADANKVDVDFTINKTDHKGQATFTAPAENGTYIVQADVHRGDDCSAGTILASAQAEVTVATYTVTLKDDDETILGTVEATYNNPMPAITVPTKFGYIFRGYYTGKNGQGTQYYTNTGASARTYELTTDLTLYAKWETETLYVMGTGADRSQWPKQWKKDKSDDHLMTFADGEYTKTYTNVYGNVQFKLYNQDEKEHTNSQVVDTFATSDKHKHYHDCVRRYYADGGGLTGSTNINIEVASESDITIHYNERGIWVTGVKSHVNLTDRTWYLMGSGKLNNQDLNWNKQKEECWKMEMENGVAKYHAHDVKGFASFKCYDDPNKIEYNVIYMNTSRCVGGVEVKYAGEGNDNISWNRTGNNEPYEMDICWDGDDIWVEAYILVHFNSMGGSDVADTRVVRGETMTAPTAPTKDGYKFVGWYTTEQLTTQFDFTTAPEQNMTLYAKWKPLTNIFTNEGGDNKWSNTANWSEKMLPDAETEVTIRAKAVVDINTAAAKSVVIDDAGYESEIEILSQGGLQVEGTITRTTDGTNYGPTTIHDLYIHSDDTGTGALVFDNSTNCQAYVEMYSKAYLTENSGKKTKYWQYLGAPVSGTNLNVDFYGAYTYLYGEVNGGWTRVKTGEMTPWNGWGITQDKATTYLLNGTLQPTTDKVLNLTYTEGGAKGDNLLANSWTAPIDITKMETTDFGAAKATLYMYNTGRDPKYGEATYGEAGANDEPGQWVTIPVESAKQTEWQGPKAIPAMQVFEVFTEKTTTLTLKYNTVVRHKDAAIGTDPLRTPARKADNEDAVSMMRIRVEGQNMHVDQYLLEGENFTTGFDNGWDGNHVEGDGRSAGFYSVNEDLGNMAVNALPEIEGTLLGFVPNDEQAFTISFGYNGNKTYFLNDLIEQKSTLIRNDQTYFFLVGGNDMTHRFQISTTPFESYIGTGANYVGDGAQKAVKFIENDKLFILRNGRLYDGTGKALKPGK